MAGKAPAGGRPSAGGGSRPPKATAPKGGGGKRAATDGATSTPGTPPPAPDQPAGTETSTDRGGDAGTRRDDTTPRRPAGLPAMPASLGSAVNSGAGFLLGVFVWGWVVLPFLQGGAGGVKKVLMAKFFNREPDGTWLP